MGLASSTVGRSLLAEFLTEAIATFFFTIICGLTFGAPLTAAVAVGFGAAILHQSEKAHLNPIISIGVALSDIYFGWINLFIRILAQIVGALLGGLLSVDGLRLTSNAQPPLDFGVNATSSSGRALLYEILFSALLVLAYLRTRNTSVLSPIVHGLVYLVAIISSGVVYAANALLNPATSFGVMIGSQAHASNTNAGNLWLFIVGPFIGCLIGVVIYQLTYALGDDDDGGSSVEETLQTTVYEDARTRVEPAQVQMTNAAPYRTGL